MGSPATSSLKRIAVTVLLAVAVGAVGYEIKAYVDLPLTDQDLTTSSEPEKPAATLQKQIAAAAPAAAASAPQQAGPAPEIAAAPPAEESPLSLLPRESFGHRAGLHKVKADLALSASAAMVVDQDTGQVLLRKNGGAVLPIASLTKLMTALVITEAKVPMDQVITITQDDVDEERHSRSRLKVGTSLTRTQALQLALMSSENRAAHALGRTFPAGLQAFVQAMNRKAAALGMKSTRYVDPTGLSTGNQSTVQDLSALAAVAARIPLLARFTTTRQRELPVAGGRTLEYHNSNRLVKSPQWDILLQKTGYIVEAGWCMLLDTKIAGHNLLVVLLDAGGAASRLGDAERIRHWAATQLGMPVKDVAPRRRHWKR
jgi:D-alanyl-D-alanine endopeptidase (penicillin-binding protein 7)